MPHSGIILSKEMHRDLRIIAAQTGVAISTLTRQAIAEYLYNHFDIESDLSVEGFWIETLSLLLQGHEWRARKYKVQIDNVKPSQILALYEKQEKKCAYCANVLTKTIEIDHIKPLARRGPHSIENICVCCKKCNETKGDKTPEEWTDRWYER
jgi:hypothetical protein